MLTEKIKILTGGLVMAFMLMLPAVSLSAQQTSITVTGTVVDEGDFPLEGVAILVKDGDGGNGTVTGADGKYKIDAPAHSTLVFMYLGYEDYEAVVNASGVVNVKMQPDSQALEESVVIGYGSARKKDLTGGVSVVDEDVLNMASTTNLMDRLVGQVAGLTITTSDAAPGSNQSLLIRGQNSLSGSNSPLIVLDGIPYDGSLADIDPNIIENMTVLKDASSVAIYGSRGSNGVILLQTKKGEVGKPKVTYKGQFGMQEKTEISSSQSGESFVNDDSSFYMMSGAENNITMSSGYWKENMISYMARINYAFAEKYMITLTGRADGASVFGRNNKYGFFPSAAVAWQIGDEDFVRDNVEWIDMLKLRVSYYIHPASGDGTLKDGQAEAVVMDEVATPWKITEAGNYRVVVNMEKREVTIYSAATDLQPKSVTFYPNGDETKEQTTVVVTDFWRYGDDAWTPGKKMNCTQSLADPQVFVYEGNLKDRVSFRITSEYTVGEDQYTIENAYAYTCPLTDTGAKQEISITLDKECKLHGGCDNPTRNSYYRFNDGKYRVIINLRTETILATAIE